MIASKLDGNTFALLIDGELVSGAATFDVVNPATEKPFAKAPDTSRAELDRAVDAARRAQPGWYALGEAGRRDALARLAQGLRDRVDDIAAIFTREQGRPIAQARGEVLAAAHLLDAVPRIEVNPELLFEGDGIRRELHYRPLGVVGAITPWNVPLIMAAGKIAEGLQGGNTMVLKPSPYTPLSSLMLGEVAADALPAGVLNVVSGGNDLGAWLVDHPGVDMITFTGSTATGKAIGASASINGLKRVVLELGGNDAAIVLEDVDVDAVAPKLFHAAFNNSGQICMAIKRLYVHDRVYDRLLEALAAIAQNVWLGDGSDPATTMGPVQNRMQFERVLDLIADARASGGRFVAGGTSVDGPGYYIAPTIVADVAEGVRLVDEEQFGPALPVIRFSDVPEAIERANATRFGLGGSIWTADPERGAEIARQLEVGTAWVNTHQQLNIDAPFGGAKESGIGRAMSALGAKSFLEAQVIDRRP